MSAPGCEKRHSIESKSSGEDPEIEEVLYAGVAQTERYQRFQLFGDNRFRWIGLHDG